MGARSEGIDWSLPFAGQRQRRGNYKEYAGVWRLSNYLKDILMASGVVVAPVRIEDRDLSDRRAADGL